MGKSFMWDREIVSLSKHTHWSLFYECFMTYIAPKLMVIGVMMILMTSIIGLTWGIVALMQVVMG